MILESLVAAIHKRRAATPQTWRLSAVDFAIMEPHPSESRICRIVDLESEILLVLLAVNAPEIAGIFFLHHDL